LQKENAKQKLARFQYIYIKCILYIRLEEEGGEVKDETANMKAGTGASNCLITNSGKRLQSCAIIRLMCRGRWESWRRRFRM